MSRIQQHLQPAAEILDLGCGYGRIALPLARASHRVVGLDLSRTLLGDALAASRGTPLPVAWVRATMTSLPFAAPRFDAVLCLWTAFFELLDGQEQALALSEAFRVLRPGGWALFEGPVYREASRTEIAAGTRSGPGDRIQRIEVDGAENQVFCHDEASLREATAAAGIDGPTVYTGPWAGRERLFLHFAKRA